MTDWISQRWSLVLSSAFAALCLVSTFLMLFARHTRVFAGMPWRLTASTAFVALAVAAGGFGSAYKALILAGVVTCWVGDWFTGRSNLLAGIAAFLLGHVLFSAAFVIRGISWRWTLLTLEATAILGVPICLWVLPHVPADHFVPVVAYVLVISAMVSLAVGTHGKTRAWVIPVGAIAFYFSDIMVARGAFVEQDKWNALIGAPLYYTAVVLLAWAIRRPADDST